MKRKGIFRLCAAALICLLAVQLCLPVLADAENTVYISDTDDLAALAERCSYDAWSKGKTVILQRDIDLGGVDFRPIPSFGGIFEGGGHRISGLSITAAVSPAGLFGTVTESGAVRGLNVEGIATPAGSGDAVGGVAGVNRGVVEDCSFTGTAQGESRVGGVVGVNEAGGVIRRGSADGGVFGKNMTGGIVGANHGTVTGCTNRSYVNTNTLDPALSFDKLDLSLAGALDTLTSPDTYNAAVDSGGVAGFSDGSILNCGNYGSVGYQHIGYNVGGVAGRSSGHIAACSNAAHIYGRREVGGVVGMAEPHVKIDLTGTSLASVRQALSELSDIVDKTANDAEGATNSLSSRLSAVNGSIAAAESNARQLSDKISDTYNDTIREINRGSELLDNTIDRLDETTKEFIMLNEKAAKSLEEIEDVSDAVSDGELGSAAADTRSAVERLKLSAEAMQEGTKALRTALSAIPPDIDGASKSIKQITDAYGTAKSARDSLNSAAKHLSHSPASAGDASDELQDAIDSLEDTSQQLSKTLVSTEALLAYLSAQEKLHFRSPEAKTESDALYDSLRGVSDNLDALNRESKASSGTILEDVRLINRQFTALMNALLNTTEDAQGYAPSSVIEDTSDINIDAVIAGKVLLCSNSGSVSGDIDVGGVAGSMLVYNALDPENDTDSISSLLRRRYELKCVLQSCTNTGDVTAKRENAGSVCGSAALGVVRDCVGCGSVKSENGDYVGGIAGSGGGSILRRCWAKCALSGAKYVGGIVGGAQADGTELRVENCRSLVEITDCVQYAGAISGGTQGSFTGNLFVSDTLAGIDCVSRAGQAEPIDYESLAAESDAPAAIRGFTLRFEADGRTVKTVPFHYGDSFDASVFPAIPPVDGMYAHWDRDDLTNLRFDVTVNAVYLPRLTALGSGFTRSANRPAFFVEGAFDSTAAFSAAPAVFAFDTGVEGAWRILRSWRRSVLEQWQLTMPDGEAHELRYLPPEGESKSLTLYLRGADGLWTAAEHSAAGSYLTFTATGETLELTVVSASTPWWLWALLTVFLLGAAALAAELLIRKHPKAEQAADAAAAAEAMKKREKLRLVLIAGVAVLGLTVGAAVKLAPRISESMGLYRLIRNYAERGDIDMSLSLSADLDGKPFAADLMLSVTQCGDSTVSCVQWEDVSVWFCDGAMLLENGKAYRAEGVMADYSQLLAGAAVLYRAADVSISEANGVKTYHASARGEDARRVLSALLPKSVLPDSETVDFDLVVTDGELTSLLVTWNSEEKHITAELKMTEGKGGHTVPQAVRAAIASGVLADAPEVGGDLARLLLAWTEGASRETLTADVTLKANCGPLLLDEALVWQRSHAYNDTLFCLSRRGSTVYYTDAAAYTGSGHALSGADAAYTGTSQLLRLACKALLLGEADCSDISGGQRYTVKLNEDAMVECAALIAPDTRSLGLEKTSGTVCLDIRDGQLSTLSLRIDGSVRVVRADVPASVSARLVFDPDAAFHTPSASVLSTLGLVRK